MKHMAIILAIALILAKPITARADEHTYPKSDKLDQYITQDLQEYIWNLATVRFPDNINQRQKYYAALIGLAEAESSFNSMAVNRNNNGSCDKGMYQINSIHIPALVKEGYIETSNDLYNPYTAAECGEREWWKCWNRNDSGWNEKTYSYYLYGPYSEHECNKYTRRVWKIQQAWYSELFGGEK